MRALDERDAPLTQARGTWRTIPEGLSKLQHVYEALRLPHPFQREGDVPSALKEAADNMIRLGESLNEWRRRRLDDLRQLAERFRDESERIVQKADSSIRAIVGNFNVPLFEHLLGVHKYSDPGAASLCTGAPIVGSFDGPDEWPVVDDAPRGWSQAEILQADEEQRNSFLRTIRRSEHDQVLWDASMKDVADGRCAGPFDTIDEALNHLGTRRAAISRRFGQVQGAKVRPCDDMKRSYVNKGCAARRRLRLSTTDSFCHTWRYTRGAARKARVLHAARAGSGRRPLRHHVHLKLWKHDLRDAYRQFPLRVDHHHLAVFTFAHPRTGRPVFFIHYVLMFGATGSVYSFNRISRAVVHIARKHLDIAFLVILITMIFGL